MKKSIKTRYLMIFSQIIVFILIIFIFKACVLHLPKIDFNENTLEYKIEEIRYKYDLPAICAVVINNEAPPVFTSVGYRNTNDINNKVTIYDKWHIGSITKSITSTLIAKLIEINSNIKWTTTIIEVFQEMENEINPAYKDVNFIDLLSHTSGIIGDISKVNGWNNYWTDTTPIVEQRYKITKDILKFSPEVQKGTYLYSNAGYVVAGAMIERLMNKSWEDLVNQYIFIPLNMINTGFGAPKPKDKQPWGHEQNIKCYIFKPVDPDNIYSDNPRVLGPAGTIHTTMHDILKFANIHLDGLKGNYNFLSEEQYQKLYHVIADSYALGWLVSGSSIYHYGCNLKWFAAIYIYYDNSKNISNIIFSAFNAAYADLKKNYDIMDEVMNTIWSFDFTQ
ncbi:MAG: serine hydrolase domain-containing protein [Spirochaetota bacterium]